MISIPIFVNQFVKKFYLIISLILISILFSGGLLKYNATLSKVENFIENELKAKINNSVLTQNTAGLSKELIFFCASIKNGFDIKSEIVIFQNQKPIAECDNEINTPLSHKNEFRLTTLDNAHYQIVYNVELWPMLSTSFLPTLLGILILTTLFILAKILIFRSLKITMRSLDDLVSHLDLLRSQDSKDIPEIKLNSSFIEVTKVVDSVNNFLLEIGALHEENKKRELITYRASIAFQIAHDIRSPLAALEMTASNLSEISEDKRLIIRNSINRIRDIANSLLDAHKGGIATSQLNTSVNTTNSNLDITLLNPTIESIITEKRIQFRDQIATHVDFNQTPESYGLFSKINSNEFKRVLSNLINNSVESFKNQKGQVEVVLRPKAGSKDQIEILIKDNGKGIPASILPTLTQRGVTHGKEGGSGLGLNHAKSTVESFGGTLQIESKEGAGTTITITLPKEEAPKWFVPKINLYPNQQLISFDDDQSIHQIWNERLKSLNPEKLGITLHHFTNPSELRKFYSQNFSDLDEHALFLMDYEILGQSETGLDLIEQLGIQKMAILVTSRYEEPAIRERCERLGVRVIPKSMSGFVPIGSVADTLHS